jgi:hypothetical protein
MDKKRAQSLLEYVILASIAITVVVMFSSAFFGKLVNTDPNNAGALGKHFNNMRGRMGVGNK